MASRPIASAPIVNWRQRRSQIADAALLLYREKPWRSVTIEDAADRLGMSYWQVYYAFDGQEDIYRSSVKLLIGRTEKAISFDAAGYPSVALALREYVRHIATVIAADDYRTLLFLCLRDGSSDPWVKTAYRRNIYERLGLRFEELIRDYGRRQGLELILLEGAAEGCITMLESWLGISPVLRNKELDSREFETVIATAAKKVVQAICTFDGFSNSAKPAASIGSAG